jgi:hypothetical protein
LGEGGVLLLLDEGVLVLAGLGDEGTSREHDLGLGKRADNEDDQEGHRKHRASHRKRSHLLFFPVRGFFFFFFFLMMKMMLLSLLALAWGFLRTAWPLFPLCSFVFVCSFVLVAVWCAWKEPNVKMNFQVVLFLPFFPSSSACFHEHQRS